MSAHARLSASSAYRWMACPGSIGGESKSSIYAAEGTFAHDIAARCLTAVAPAASFIGIKGEVDGFKFECTPEMAEAIQVYIDVIAADLQTDDRHFIELPLLTALQSVDQDFGGTADFVRYRPSAKALRVVDYKHGSGTYVEVIDNKQAKMYALGALLALEQIGCMVATIEVMIVQPRFEGADPVRHWMFNAVDLMDFAADLKEAAAATRQPHPPRVAGDHCKFCPQTRTCPALRAKQTALVADKFEVADPSVLAQALADIPLVKARIKAIEEYAYQQAVKGEVIPGYKLVDKRPVKKWKSTGDVIEWAQANGIDPYAPREIITPAQMEAKLKETAPRGQKTEAANQVAEFIEKVSSGPVLVPDADSRPAIRAAVTADSFSVFD